MLTPPLLDSAWLNPPPHQILCSCASVCCTCWQSKLLLLLLLRLLRCTHKGIKQSLHCLAQPVKLPACPVAHIV
jgi:hypothetical protein